MVIPGLVIILILVLILPFAWHKVEENLEAFLFVMGILACIISGHLSLALLLEALEEPIKIAAAVLIAGALFFVLRDYFARFMKKVFAIVPLWLVAFLSITALGLLSSIITAIIASIILVEIIYLLPLERNNKIVVCVIACFAIGLGATLTPIGEPLATIAIAKLNQDFFFLFNLLGKFVIPAVVFFGILGAAYIIWNGQRQKELLEQGLAITAEPEQGLEKQILAELELEQDTWRGIVVRALKIYLFVMALVFLGEGFQPIVDTYILTLDYRLLYWVNMVSAVLDNATLTAAEISIQMTTIQIEAILMGLLISGGMLIPGNIPNIISASKLKISSTEWAKVGVPMGLVVMVVFYFILF